MKLILRLALASCALFALAAPAYAQDVTDPVWYDTYNGASNLNDHSDLVATDSKGNVYVVGYSYENGTSQDTADIKIIVYNPAGTVLWQDTFDGPGSGDDFPYAIAIDSKDNLYIAGSTTQVKTGTDFMLLKYEPTNKKRTDFRLSWARYGTKKGGASKDSDAIKAMAIDKNGNIYVTGSSFLEGFAEDYYTIRYDTKGNVVWEARTDGGAKGKDIPRAITVDSSANVYVTGVSQADGSSTNYLTVKYSNLGKEVWKRKYNGSVSGSDDAQALVLNSSGRYLYVVGNSDGISKMKDIAVVRYDTTNGNSQVARYDGKAHKDDTARGIAIDKDGNVWIVGTTQSVGNKSDIITLKFSKDLNQLKALIYDNSATHLSDQGNAIAVDNRGYIWVTGHTTNKDGTTDLIVIQYTLAGNINQIGIFDGPANKDDAGTSIVIDANGDAYVVGYTTGIGQNFDFLIAKFNRNY